MDGIANLRWGGFNEEVGWFARTAYGSGILKLMITELKPHGYFLLRGV
jgi:hypothetical protein